MKKLLGFAFSIGIVAAPCFAQRARTLSLDSASFANLVARDMTAINSSVNDFDPTITGDGLTMFFTSDRPGGVGGEDFWMTTRASATDTAWTAPVDVTDINSTGADGAASISLDGKTIYFATSRATSVGGDVDIWTATFDGTNWTNVHALPGSINTTAWETQPAISPDGQSLYFASNRPGKIGTEVAWAA